jgi:hypothetical protein
LEQNSKSRASGHFYLINKNNKDFNNGALLLLTSVIKHVMSPALEAELVALLPLHTTLEEMGHQQSDPTPVTTDNATAHSLTMGLMTPKASKPNDMWIHWLKCHSAQSQFLYQWHKGALNRADYTSKHHAPAHHSKMRTSL